MVFTPKSLLRRFLLTERHRLIFPASPAVNRNSFAAKTICEPVGLIYAKNSGFFGEIYGFTDCSVAVLLESGLHFDVPFGFDVISTFEDFTYAGRDLSDLLDTSGFGNLFFEFFAVKAGLGGDLFEDRIYLEYF